MLLDWLTESKEFLNNLHPIRIKHKKLKLIGRRITDLQVFCEQNIKIRNYSKIHLQNIIYFIIFSIFLFNLLDF